MKTAIVVGSGPNGLAAAVVLARAGVDVTVYEAAEHIGGGARSSEAILPGLLHDHCSGIHPMAVCSPFLRNLGLDRYGLSWAWADIDCAHPLDDGSAGLLYRSVDDTAAGLGTDADQWRRLFAGPAERFDALADDVLRPLLRIPKHPLAMTRFGLPALAPATVLSRVFRTDRARALFGGVAAHAFRPLHRPMTSAIGIGIITAGHRHGWPVAVGGTGAITTSLAALLAELGGKIETSVRITARTQLPPADVTLFDLVPGAVADILGDRLPARVARTFRRYAYGPGAFKVDFAVEGGVPWTAPEAGRAVTVHLGGSFGEIASTERAIDAGTMPSRPFVVVGQQYLADQSRSAGDVKPLWTYAHVPHGYTGDATAAIISQVERFAPGFRDRVLGMAVRTTTEMAAYNPNYVGGNIVGGTKNARQLVFGARTTLQPYGIGIPGMYLCSAATPPGPGAHGMCGANAAAAALHHLGRASRRSS
jgi:phytoene dehydrogenase-like protein